MIIRNAAAPSGVAAVFLSRFSAAAYYRIVIPFFSAPSIVVSAVNDILPMKAALTGRRGNAVNLYDYVRANHREDLLLEWDRAANTGLDPSALSPGSRKKIAWICEKGHRYKASLCSRTIGGTGCPYCANRKVLAGETDLATRCPEAAALWDTEANGCGPDQVMPNSHRVSYWRCPQGHSWQARVYTVTSGNGCPYCSRYRALPGETDMVSTHPELAAEWDEEKNGMPASQVLSGASFEAWWRCKKGHSYQALVYSRLAGTDCPYCTGKLVLPGFNDLATTDPQLAGEWADTTVSPSEVNRGSHKLVTWRCPVGHDYQAAVYARVAGNGCPYCTGRKVLAGFNDLATTHPKVAAQWDRELNGNLTPQMVSRGCGKKVWWRCAEGHVWQAAVFSRTRKKASDCPICAGKLKPRYAQRYEEVIKSHRPADTRPQPNA